MTEGKRPPPRTPSREPNSEVGIAIVRYLDGREERYHERLRALVDINSGIDNPEGRLACLSHLERHYRLLGFTTERVDRGHGMVHLVGRRPARVANGHQPPRLLIVGHFDTVFDSNTAFLGMSRMGEWVHGPGVGDMKGGLVVAQAALEGLEHAGVLDRLDVVVVHNADEEIGSPTSRDLIEALAADRDLALDFEVGRASGAMVCSRAGIGRYFVQATGRSAHAGMHHAKGRNAIVALARAVDRFAALTDYDLGTTVNVGTVAGGAKRNIVADRAHCELDIRIRLADEGPRIHAAIEAICAELSTDGITVAARGGLGRPPWPRSDTNDTWVQHFLDVAGDLGVGVTAEDTGGGSDANFTAAMGIPTIDALGPVGEGVHTENERIKLHTLVERAKLVAIALRELRVS